MSDSKIKCLLITGTTLRNDTNSGKTLMTLFSDFSSKEIDQLYFSVEKPNVVMCGSYYQINEWDLLHSFLGIVPYKCGRIYKQEDIDLQDSIPQKNPPFLKKNADNTFIIIARAILWLLPFWRNRKYRAWLESVKPAAVFTVMTGETNQVASVYRISKKYDCPVVMYITDDYYTDYQNHTSLFRLFHYKRLHNAYKKLSSRLSEVIGLSEEAAEEFGKKFGCRYETLFAACDQTFLNLPLKSTYDPNNIVFRYFGGLSLERWKVLSQLAESIKRINYHGRKAILEVFSAEDNEEIIKALSVENGCVFKGWVYGEQYHQLLSEADIAVHVESFSQEMITRTKLSISTKITDYLGAGKCILAIGDNSLSSIRHVTNVAKTVTQLNELDQVVRELIEDSDQRKTLQAKARSFAQAYHNRIAIAGRMREIIADLTTK